MAESFESIQEFLETGGQVLNYIGILIFLMWVLILERIIYLFFVYKGHRRDLITQWKERPERQSWNAEQIRQAMISRTRISLNQSLSTIQAFVALCPLLGLLGTVTGMIEVFDVMAISGSGNARSMASGVSKATIPTMAGMVGALSGVFASTWLKRTAKKETELLEDKLVLDH
ncbi:MotA/TolQ/ExbB proton channel family protein [Aliikangiella coralliicola]|uniref:MotA/TolQ/ExbB proton channel family protein n=1 Tax=Aliikangiella coralliicola TaxID=2592383 RepID=A0A545UGV9_9GAMM|nr:MotA/TolQ/ExbB proton channel family protein [Aliikangiella coralliicola]